MSSARLDPQTLRATEMLRARKSVASSPFVFPKGNGKPYLVTSMNHLHQTAQTALGLCGDFVLQSLRHTMQTRLGEASVDAFTIMRIAGHSSMTVSQRWLRPSPEAVERAFERLQGHS